jgi:hypothetical protein
MHAPLQALTTRETAKVLALTVPQVHDLVRTGDLDVVEVRGRACPRAESVLRIGERLAARRLRLLVALERDLPPSVRQKH